MKYKIFTFLIIVLIITTGCNRIINDKSVIAEVYTQKILYKAVEEEKVRMEIENHYVQENIKILEQDMMKIPKEDQLAYEKGRERLEKYKKENILNINNQTALERLLVLYAIYERALEYNLQVSREEAELYVENMKNDIKSDAASQQVYESAFKVHEVKEKDFWEGQIHYYQLRLTYTKVREKYFEGYKKQHPQLSKEEFEVKSIEAFQKYMDELLRSPKIKILKSEFIPKADK